MENEGGGATASKRARRPKQNNHKHTANVQGVVYVGGMVCHPPPSTSSSWRLIDNDAPHAAWERVVTLAVFLRGYSKGTTYP